MSSWKIKRKDNQQEIELPLDMRWLDEFEWSALAQSSPQYSLGGAVVLQQGTKLAGRTITLGGNWIWLPRSVLTTLQEWSEVPELEMTLTHYDGRTFNVCFARPALSNIEPVHYLAPEDTNAQYEAPQIHLMTI